MQQDILIIGVMFPATLMINFGNRYTVPASLIRDLHDAVISDNPRWVMPSAPVTNTLRKRLRLIGIVRTISALAFCLCTVGDDRYLSGHRMVSGSAIFHRSF